MLRHPLVCAISVTHVKCGQRAACRGGEGVENRAAHDGADPEIGLRQEGADHVDEQLGKAARGSEEGRAGHVAADPHVCADAVERRQQIIVADERGHYEAVEAEEGVQYHRALTPLLRREHVGRELLERMRHLVLLLRLLLVVQL